MSEWLPWVCVVAVSAVSWIETRRHGRYMYRLALQHVEEDIARARHEGFECDAFEVTSSLRKCAR